MTALGPDRSRDRRIEDPSNLWIVHPAARQLLPLFLARGISANVASVGGFVIGAASALAYYQWRIWPFACIGLLLSLVWLVADGLDGMIARATNTASSLGRFLDGLCDHGVFLLIYVALAASIGTPEAWLLGTAAGLLHALQSNVYESERARFHRRSSGAASSPPAPGSNLIMRRYDQVASFIDGLAYPFDELLRRDPDPLQLGTAYAAIAVKPLRLMSLLSANVRVFAIFLACMAGKPALFWWFEIVPLTFVLILGLTWHRAVEARFLASRASQRGRPQPTTSTQSKDMTN